MSILVSDPQLEESLIRQRQTTGADRYDEVWEGVYVMAPMPNTEHQMLVAAFTAVLQQIVAWANLGKVCPGVNLSDRDEGWIHDYRVPDVAVLLSTGTAIDHGPHWEGAVDFLVEVISPDDLTLDKLPFYERLGVREVLVVDRDPWTLSLLRHTGGRLVEVGQVGVGSSQSLASEVVPLTFRLVPGEARPQIVVEHPPSGRSWPV